MEKRPFFRAATAGLEKYHTGGYGRIGVYRVKIMLPCDLSHELCVGVLACSDGDQQVSVW